MEDAIIDFVNVYAWKFGADLRDTEKITIADSMAVLSLGFNKILVERSGESPEGIIDPSADRTLPRPSISEKPFDNDFLVLVFVVRPLFTV